MIIDSHAHIGGPPPQAEPDEVVKLLNRFSLDKMIVCRYFYGESTLKGNEYVYEAVRRHSGKLIGFAWLNPNEDKVLDEFELTVLKWGLKGVKIHLELHPSTEGKLTKLFKALEEYNVPVYIHLGEDIQLIKKMCKTFKLNVMIGHLGTGVYKLDFKRLRKALDIVSKCDNVYLETSGNTYYFIEYAVKEVGASKLIFGSDFPHEHPIVCVRAIELLDLTTRERRMILGENVEKIVEL